MAGLLQGTQTIINSSLNPLANTKLVRAQSALLETGKRFLRDYPKQPWIFNDVEENGKQYAVQTEVVKTKPFADLLRIKREGLSDKAPKALFVSALSGHHATLSTATFQEFLPDHEVYVTDWLDAKHVPLTDGVFDLQEYIRYVIEFLELIGPETHLIGLCQAGPAVTVATAVMEKNAHQCKPKSTVVMASPMNMEINPGFISKVSKVMTSEMWSTWGVYTVPLRYKGKGRKVYPGSVQLTNFMSMNIKNHVKAHVQFAKDTFHQKYDEAEAHKTFYDEYYAVLDMTEEFCIETLERVFIRNELARGDFVYQDEVVDLNWIKSTPFLAMEGANDDMIRPGQCNSILDSLSGLSESQKEAYVQTGVGHYGIFNGSIYRKEIAPKIKTFLRKEGND